MMAFVLRRETSRRSKDQSGQEEKSSVHVSILGR